MFTAYMSDVGPVIAATLSSLGRIRCNARNSGILSWVATGVRMQGELLLERAEARSTPASLRARFRKQARCPPIPSEAAGTLAELPASMTEWFQGTCTRALDMQSLPNMQQCGERPVPDAPAAINMECFARL